MRRFILLITISAIGLLLSTDEFDDFWGRLPDPGCLSTAYSPSIDESIYLDIWYGSDQSYGSRGRPQPWINLLGTVISEKRISSLAYSLNGSEPRPLNIGPDGRRLACTGDFNIEIDSAELIEGRNLITITAVDRAGNQAAERVSIGYTGNAVWPLPYSVVWNSVGDLTDALQIVDGRWFLEEDGLKTGTISYDRLVALGSMSWRDYEIRFPFQLHRYDATEFPSNGAGLGVILRWNGHNDIPIKCEQPRCGWLNYGASGWYGWDEIGNPKGLSLSGYMDSEIGQDVEMVLNLEEWYYLKMRVESVPGENEIYSLKIWRADAPEPVKWNLSGAQEIPGPQGGSALLIAHHVDITFGDISVVPLP